MNRNSARAWVAVGALCGLALGACASGPETAAPGNQVSVHFVAPETFADAGRPYRPAAVAAPLGELRDHVVRRATSLLGAGHHLKVQITEVDRAGEVEWWRPRLHGMRVVRNIYPPRSDLRFELIDPSGVVLLERELKPAAAG